MAIDPMCQMEVDEETAKYVSVYKGKKYYFCTLECKEEFDKLGKSKYPVYGMEVDEKLTKWVSKYKNKTYYFWSLACKEEFEADPEKYLND